MKVGCEKLSLIYFIRTWKKQLISSSSGWYRTGDMGYYDDKGDLVVFGRIKEIIKYKNHNISAIELENVIKSHKAIQEVAVMPLPDATNEQHPVAFVTTKPELQVKIFKNKHNYVNLINFYGLV